MIRLIAAEILFSLAIYGLQAVPRGEGAWTLAGIAVVAALLPGLLWLARRPGAAVPAALRRWLDWAIGGLAVLQIAFGLFRIARLKVIDIGQSTLDAITALTHGGNPYALPIDPIAGGIAGMGDAYHGYKYLPVMLAAYAPAGLLMGLRGIVATNIALQGAMAAALGAVAARGGSTLAARATAVLYLSLPFLAFQLLARGVNDLVPMLPLVLALYLADRMPFWSGVLVGLSIAAKLMPGAAMVMCLVPPPGERQAYGWGAAVGLLPILPLAIGAPVGFLDNVVLFNAMRPIDDTSWLWGLPAIVAVLARGAALLALAALYLRVWRHPPALKERTAFVALAVLLVFAVGPDMHHNYYLWFIPLLAPLTAWAALGSEDSPPVSESA